VNGSLTAAWLAEIVVITYRSSKQGTLKASPIPGLPVPSAFAASFVIYGALSFVPGDRGRAIASAFGWGLVAATVLNLWDPATLGRPGGPAVKGAQPATQGATP